MGVKDQLKPGDLVTSAWDGVKLALLKDLSKVESSGSLQPGDVCLVLATVESHWYSHATCNSTQELIVLLASNSGKVGWHPACNLNVVEEAHEQHHVI